MLLKEVSMNLQSIVLMSILLKYQLRLVNKLIFFIYSFKLYITLCFKYFSIIKRFVILCTQGV